MSDTKSLLAAVARLRREDVPFLVATVVRVLGSSYRRPGARMLLTRDRWIAGSVSGGCLEGDVVRKGWWRTRDGAPRIVTYDATMRDDVRWGFGLGCDGVVDVLLERAGVEGRVDPFSFLEGCVATQRRGAIATVLDDAVVHVGARVAVRADGVVESDVDERAVRASLVARCREILDEGETRVVGFTANDRPIDVLVEVVRPPLRLFVLGAGHDAVPLASLARTLGWEAIVCEPHGRFATRERFPDEKLLVGSNDEVAAKIDESDRAVAVLMAHDYERDRASLKMLLATRVKYIGALGPKRRTARMLDELGMPDDDPRLHAPVGLDLGAESPQEIALAITAEIQAALAHRSASSLRARRSSIHAMQADAAE